MKIIVNIPAETIKELKDGCFGIKHTLYDLAGAICDGIVLPDNATNGDMIKAMLQVVGYTPLSTWAEEKRKKSGFRVHIKDEHKCDFSLTVSEDWWNAPYKGGQEDGKA